MDDGDHKFSTRTGPQVSWNQKVDASDSPKHHSVTSSAANEKKVTSPATLTPNVTFKNSSLKATREF